MSASEAPGATVPPSAQYDLIADLLEANMFKVYADMLKSDKRVKGGQAAKFGYLPMMSVATLGALNAESFCERVLSCVKLVVSDLHVRLKPSQIRMLVSSCSIIENTHPNKQASSNKQAISRQRGRVCIGGQKIKTWHSRES